jgi:2-polyprenyl-6-methoxyphenol hydroxylase-like FAD-dependent oxidoreductase
MPPTSALDTTCCIIGGGPAGIMLGYLLARSGVPVTVLEKHPDFFRDFRGDTVHPSTLQLLHELGMLDRFLQVPHSKVSSLCATIGGKQFQMADFSHLPTTAKYIALMPQWDFLNFLVKEASAFPNFTLRMGWEATGLLRPEPDTNPSRVIGVHANTPDGPTEIRADLTVGCDGRHAISREAAHLKVVEQGVPIDVLWFHLARQPGDPENALGYVNYGRALILINRNDYYQAGFIIAKGFYPDIQKQGLDAFRASLEQLAPFLAGRTAEIDSWDKIKLLTVQINHLDQWWTPGLLCIGDAAHAMSPVGGIGINIALQDAVAAANILAEPLRTHTLTDDHLQSVQKHRIKAVLRTQRVQSFAHNIINRALHHQGPMAPPVFLRFATSVPGFQRLTGRFVGIGLQPEHIRLARAHTER